MINISEFLLSENYFINLIGLEYNYDILAYSIFYWKNQSLVILYSFA